MHDADFMAVHLLLVHNSPQLRANLAAANDHSAVWSPDLSNFCPIKPTQVAMPYLQAVTPGLNVTSIPLNSNVTPSPKGTLAPSVSYKLIKLDQTDSADGTPKFMLAGQDANEPLLPVTEKTLKNRKVKEFAGLEFWKNAFPLTLLTGLCILSVVSCLLLNLCGSWLAPVYRPA